MPALTQPEETFKQILEEMGFVVKPFTDKCPGDEGVIYMQVPFLSYYLDFASLDNKIAIEINGEYWHGSSGSLTAAQLKQKLHDSNKSQELERDGWTLFKVPASSLSNERMKLRLVQYVKSIFAVERTRPLVGGGEST